MAIDSIANVELNREEAERLSMQRSIFSQKPKSLVLGKTNPESLKKKFANKVLKALQ